MSTATRRLSPFLFCSGVALAATGAAPVPPAIDTPAAISANRTLVLAIAVDREQARLVSFTVKERPYLEAPAAADGPSPDPLTQGAKLDLGPDPLAPGLDLAVGLRVDGELRDLGTQRVQGLCLDHDPDAPPHIEGDTIRLHRDTLLVEAPELIGLEAVEVSYAPGGESEAATVRASLALDAARFTGAGGGLEYADLAFALPGEASSRPAPETSGQVHWPEEYGDPDRYLLQGNAAEIARRINLVIVPDGYLYAEKTLMQAHAQALVNGFRLSSPYAEHDRFFNYILVYAYSNQSGTDQCDCEIVADTAMNTRFPSGGACADPANRCLYYGASNGGVNCDPNVAANNIAAAELRAPARDATIIMVNTPRYGGCGGSRAVYSAGHVLGNDIGRHELGHSLAALDDEYGGNPACGSASGINSSSDPVNGTWPEWIADLGSPRQSGRYFDQCVYRPFDDCVMRSVLAPVCAVCRQRWALTVFGHARVSPTAPLLSSSPASSVQVDVGTPVMFSVTTRFSSHAAVTNSRTWTLQAPGQAPVVVATGVDSYIRSFSSDGTYYLRCELVADANLIKPARNGANVDRTTWTIDVRRLPPGRGHGRRTKSLSPRQPTGGSHGNR